MKYPTTLIIAALFCSTAAAAPDQVTCDHCRANFGIIVSRGGFTQGAHDFRRNKPILFVDLDDLIAMQEGRDVLAAAFAPDDATPRHQ